MVHRVMRRALGDAYQICNDSVHSGDHVAMLAQHNTVEGCIKGLPAAFDDVVSDAPATAATNSDVSASRGISVRMMLQEQRQR